MRNSRGKTVVKMLKQKCAKLPGDDKKTGLEGGFYIEYRETWQKNVSLGQIVDSRKCQVL